MRRRILEKGYVTVRPKKEIVQWVDVNAAVDYNIYSNTHWNIQ